MAPTCTFMSQATASATVIDQGTSCFLIDVGGGKPPVCLGALMEAAYPRSHDDGFVPAVPEAQYCAYQGAIPCLDPSDPACKHGSLPIAAKTLCHCSPFRRW